MIKYELLKTTNEGVKIYARIDEDGLCRVTCTEDNLDYQAWLNPSEVNYLTPPAIMESTQPDEADLTEGNN
jgi:hypothetical protein